MMKCEHRRWEPGGCEPLREGLWCCLEETVPRSRWGASPGAGGGWERGDW